MYRAGPNLLFCSKNKVSADRNYVLKIKSSADRRCLWTESVRGSVNTLCSFYF